MPTPYAFDPTGILPANRITGEQHIITAVANRNYHFTVPTYAPFFADGLTISYRDIDNNIRFLVEGIDYHLGFQFIAASRSCAKPIYGGISYLNLELAGVVTLVYQTVGGNWTVDAAQINEILSDTMRNPRVTSWETVAEVPALFPVVDHEWNLQDLVGMSDVKDAIEGISLAVADAPVPAPPVYNWTNATKQSVGLGNVQNYGIATDQESIDGVSITKYVTPRGVKLAVEEYAGPASTVPLATTTVAGKVILATGAEALAGANSAKAVTPLALKSVADTKANTAHTHAIANVTGLQTALDGKIDKGITTVDVTGHVNLGVSNLSAAQVSKSIVEVTGTLTSNITLTIPYQTLKPTLFINKTTSSGGNWYVTLRCLLSSSVTSLSSVNVLANQKKYVYTDFSDIIESGGGFNNAELTGVPTAPTAANGNTSTQIATTQFVQNAVASTVPANTVTTIDNQTIGGIKVFTLDAYFNGVRVGKGAGSGNGYNTSAGAYALGNNTTGEWNTATGFNALQANTTGYSNTANGTEALAANVLGLGNTAMGHEALNKNTSGGVNAALGYKAAYSNITGDYNTSMGAYSMYSNTTGFLNTAIGGNSLFTNSTSGNNTAVGSYSLYYNVGSNNTGVGYATLYSNTTGSRNTAIGINALDANTTYNESTGLGYNAQVTGTGQIQLGNSLNTTYAYGAVQNRSDARDKADIRDTVLGLDFINLLRPVDFRWDYRDAYKPAAPMDPVIPADATEEETASIKSAHEAALAQYREACKFENLVRDGSKKRSRYHHGLIAQEVKTVLDNNAVDFGGYQDHKVSGGEDVLSIGYEELIAPLIKAVQQLSQQNKALELRIVELEAKSSPV